MVPPSSHRVSRVRRYSGSSCLTSVFAYETITLCGGPSHVLLLTSVNSVCCPYPGNISTPGLASSAFARHYWRNLCWFLFLALLRCFSSGGSPHTAMYSQHDTWVLLRWVSPFGYSRVIGCFRLTVTFRRSLRPSSAPGAKAFPLRSL